MPASRITSWWLVVSRTVIGSPSAMAITLPCRVSARTMPAKVINAERQANARIHGRIPNPLIVRLLNSMPNRVHQSRATRK